MKKKNKYVPHGVIVMNHFSWSFGNKLFWSYHPNAMFFEDSNHRTCIKLEIKYEKQ